MYAKVLILFHIFLL